MKHILNCSVVSCVKLLQLDSTGSSTPRSPSRICHRYISSMVHAILLAVFLCPGFAEGAPNLVFDSNPITWNVIGLDHNNVNEGPTDFPVGIRVKNTGTMDALNVNADFAFTTTNPYISLLDDNSLTTSAIHAGGYADFYFTVRIARNASAYLTTKGYTITITGGGLANPLVTADTLLVEQLRSQESNDVLMLLGPQEIEAGQVRTFVLIAETQNNGRDQVEQFVNFPNDLFRILNVTTEYTEPGVTIDKFYGDACGWNRVTNTCVGNPPDQYGGMVGEDITTTYTVEILQTPTSVINLTALIYDFGSVYHYNSDFGEDILGVRPPADLFVVKTAVDNPVEAGNTVEYLISAVNPDPNTTAEDVILSDTLPAGLTFLSANPPPTSGPNPLLWNLGDIGFNTSATVSVIAQTSCLTTGPLTNHAFASSTTPDSNLTNNSTSQTIVVQDTTPPTLECPLPIVDSADSGFCEKTNVTFTVPAGDNCNAVSVVNVPASGSTFPVGTTIVTSTATDASGNQTSCTFTVTILDSQAPSIMCDADITLPSDSETCSRANVPVVAPSASDNCTTTVVDVEGLRSDAKPLSDPYPVGTTTITWTATDQAGLTATCTQDVIITDTKVPVVDCPENITVSADSGICDATDVTFEVPATDNCSAVTVVAVPPSGSTFPVGTTTVDVTATDTAGNEATCSFTVTVTDDQEPTIGCPETVNAFADPMSCSASNVNIGVPTIGDNCANPTFAGVRSDMLALDAPYPVGITTITWTVTDASNNMASCMQSVIVADKILPAIVCPATIDVTADPLECSAAIAITTEPLTSDNCSTESLVGIRSDNLPLTDPYPVGITTITWTVTDSATNSASCQQDVIVRDGTPPMITCPMAINVSADSEACSASNVNVAPPTLVSDNCTTIAPTVNGTRSDMLALNAPYPVGTTTITWKATDAAGNMATCTQDVNVADETDPTIECPDTVNAEVGPSGCTAAGVTITQPTANDNCTVASVSGTRSDMLALDAPYPLGTTIITWKVTDGTGNMMTCDQSVIVTDTTAPGIECPPTINVTADALSCEAAVAITTEPLTTDNCSTASLVGLRSDMQALDAPYPLGTTTITWTVTDGSGNSKSCTQDVVVTDGTAPTVICPDPITQGNTEGMCGAIVNFTIGTSDACGNSSVTVVAIPPSGTMFPVGTTTVNVTATDGAENVSRCSFDVTITDTENPVVVCPQNIITCMQDVDLGSPSTSDNCGTQTLEITRSDNKQLSEDYPVGVTLVTYTLTDNAGNVGSCTQSVTVLESVLPAIVCPDDITVEALAGLCVSGPVDFPDPMVMDNCSTDTTNLTITFSPEEGSAFPLGETIVTATVTDPMQNSASCTFKVTVIDVTAPQLTCPDDITENNTTGQCGAAQVNFQIPSVDSCSNPVVVVANPPSGSPFPVGTTVVNVTATDTAGNQATCSFTVTINDTQMPTIQCPPAVNVTADVDQCQAAVVNLGLPLTADNCSTASLTAVRSDGKLLSEPYPVGTTTVTWTVTDASNNMASCQQQVIVRDDMMPDISCPGDITVEALAGQCVSGPVEYLLPLVSDNCTGPNELVVTFDPPQGSTFPVGTSTVTVTVRDLGGNETTCTFDVTVTDVTPPQLTCPMDITTNNTPGQCGASGVTFEIPSLDACSGPVVVVADPPSGSTFPVGTTVVNITATDAANNTARCSFNVTVTDNELPGITCPPAVDVAANANCQATGVELGQPTTSDNCATATLAATRSDGQLLSAPYPIGTTTVTWTVTDSAGQTASCTQTVTVRDDIMPTIECSTALTVAAAGDTCMTGPVQYPTPTISDNCTPVENLVVTYDPPQGSTFPLGMNHVTVTVTDGAGNQAMCDIMIIVVDITPPVITCPGNIVAENTADQCGNASVDFEVTAVDSCSNPVMVVTNPLPGTAFPVGTTTVNAMAKDAAGNVAVCSFTVTVNDTQAPAIVCPTSLVVPADSGSCEATNVTYSAVATDNCAGPVTVTYAPPSGSALPVGVTTVLVTATDGSGNSATCSFTVTVEDREPPRIQCLDSVTAVTIPCEFDVAVALDAPVVADGCETLEEATLLGGNGNGKGKIKVEGKRSDNRPLNDRFPVGKTTVTWTASDVSGNLSVCTQDVTVEAAQCQPVCDGPDLVIMTKMFPTYKCGGKTVPKCKVNGWYVVTNIGTQTSGETSVCFYISDDEVLDAGDIQFKQSKKYRIKSLRPGEMVGIDLKGKAPKGVDVTTKFILGVVDCPGVVIECREDNNVTADMPMPPMKKK